MDVEKQEKRGQVCVPQFQGFTRAKVSKTEQQHTVSRAQAVNSATDLANARDAANAMLERFLQSAPNAAQHLDSCPSFEPSLVQTTAPRPAQDQVLEAVQRDVQGRLRRDMLAKQLEAEDAAAATLFKEQQDASTEGGGAGDVFKGKSFGVEHIKTSNFFKLMQQKVEDVKLNVEKAFNEIDGKLNATGAPRGEDVDSGGGDANADGNGGFEKLRQELSEAKIAALRDVVAVKEKMEVAGKKLQDAKTFSQLQDIKKEVMTIEKSVRKIESLQNFKKVVRQVRKFFSTASRKQSLAANEDAAVPDVLLASDLHTKMESVHGVVKDHNVSSSLFEAKAGLRVATISLTSLNDSMRQALLACAPIKKAFKELGNQLKSEETAVKSFGDNALVKIEKLLKKFLSAHDGIFTKVCIPKELEWGTKVYPVQAHAQRYGTCTASVLHFGAMESRLLLQGSQLIGGIPFEKVPGETLKDKRSYVFSCDQKSLQDLFQDGGWLLKLAEASVAVIPSGFLIVCSSTGTVGLRWSCCGDVADTARVIDTLSALLAAYPEMRSSRIGYAEFLDYIRG